MVYKSENYQYKNPKVATLGEGCALAIAKERHLFYLNETLYIRKYMLKSVL